MICIVRSVLAFGYACGNDIPLVSVRVNNAAIIQIIFMNRPIFFKKTCIFVTQKE
ncbi:MAG: hypothetical protein ACJART_001798 [Maribacter sp.]